MRIACISDTHGSQESIDFTDFKDCDVLIHAGDFTRTVLNQDTEIPLFLDWLDKQPFEHKILVAGNHEVWIEKNQEKFNDLLDFFPSITYLQDSETTIDGIKFYGSPYSNEFCNLAFMDHDQGLKKIWSKIPNNTNVLITHGPAKNCLDKVINQSPGFSKNVGSLSLANRKLELKNLKVHVSAHIHEEYGTLEFNNQLNICPSIMNEKYQTVNKPIAFEIKGDSE